MFKIFERGSKINFIDSEDNLVGFDTSDDCCAHGGYFLSPRLLTDGIDEHEGTAPTEKLLEEYRFDPTFFKEVGDVNKEGYRAVIFKLIKGWWGRKESDDLYLYLFNCHNGYYSKGFSKKFDDVVIGSI